jgi:hypothetical protein
VVSTYRGLDRFLILRFNKLPASVAGGHQTGVCNPVSESTVGLSRLSTLGRMDNKMPQFARQAVLAASQRLNTEERVRAFLAHSRMMVAMYRAGQRLPRRGFPR